MYLFLAVLGLHCCAWAFSSCGVWGFSLQQLLLLQSMVSSAPRLQQLWLVGSIVARKLSCRAACGIFPDQGSNPRSQHWQTDSYPLCHQESPGLWIFLLKGSNLKHYFHVKHGDKRWDVYEFKRWKVRLQRDVMLEVDEFGLYPQTSCERTLVETVSSRWAVLHL